MDAGDYDGAIADYEGALIADASVAESRRNRHRVASAYAGRGNARTHAGDYAGAHQDYAFATELTRDLPEPTYTQETDRLIDQGGDKESKGDYDGAIADYD